MSAYASALIAERIIERAASLSGFAPAQITGPRRHAELTEVRFACMVAMHHAGMTHGHIGRRLGGRDHTTVINGLKRAEKLRTAPEYDALVSALEGV